MERKLSGYANPAYEESELNTLESGRNADESMTTKERNSREESFNCLTVIRRTLGNFITKHHKICRWLGLGIFNLLILTYFVFASIHWRNNKFEDGFDWCNGYGMLVLILGLSYFGVIYYTIIKRYCGEFIVRCFRPVCGSLKSIQNTKYGSIIGQSAVYLLIFAAIIVFLLLDTAESRERLISVGGVLILLSFGWLFSKHPGYIKWRPVLCGLILQFGFGLLTIRWEVGRAVFQCVSNKVATFLDFAKDGSKFIFSDKLVLTDGVFAFSVLPVIFYFSFIIQTLYHLGAMQWVIMKLGWILQCIMGTTLCESINCAANTFIGMSESPLLIKPYLNKLTASELHAIMCSGFASVSGTVLAAYIGFGAQPAHLLTASVMSAPASLCYSKLFYPETEKSLTSFDNIKLEKSQDSSLLDAASKGALAAIPIVLGIIANIVAFVSFVALVNALLGWLGILVGYEGLTFELILSKLFMPLSWIMGVPWDQCEDVGTLIGLKTVVNEFVAYQKLGEYKKQGRIYGRTEAIATFAICGFSNPGSLAIMLGVLTSLAPNKKEVISGSIVRAFIAGSAVTFMTASIAGTLTTDDFFDSAANATMATADAGSALSTVVS